MDKILKSFKKLSYENKLSAIKLTEYFINCSYNDIDRKVDEEEYDKLKLIQIEELRNYKLLLK